MYEIPEEFGPVVDSGQNDEESRTELARYDVTISDLLDAKMLNAGQRLHMSYKPRNGQHRDYVATICADGSIELLGKHFSSPSYAAVYGIQDAGSARKTVNGWTAWRLENRELLAAVRERYLARE
jgi:hypothetical protein